MATERRASVVWEGDLLKGRGQVTAESSGLFRAQPVSWAARSEKADGKTSPEELLAAAHASCFAMALSSGLAKSGKPPERLEVSATVKFDPTANPPVQSSALDVRGRVPGLDAAGFQQAAETAKENCPISRALRGNVVLSVHASLL